MKKLIENKIKLLSLFLLVLGMLGLIKSGVIRFNPTDDRIRTTGNKELKEFYHSVFRVGKSHFTLDQANSIAVELIPLIEKITGKKFKKQPVIKLIDGKELEKILILESDIKILNNSNKLVESGNKFFPNILKTYNGLYGARDQTVYLLPKRIESICKVLNIDKKNRMEVFKIIIAHELTHALQDQYLNLWYQRNQFPGKEELDAFSVTIEGHAVFVAKEVGKKIGVDEKIINLFPIMKSIQKKNREYHKVQHSNASQNLLKDPYTLGEIFINYHYSKGGNKLLWEILLTPPVHLSMIFSPETYSPQSYSYINYKRILDNLYNYNSHYKKCRFVYKNNSISQLDLRLDFKDVDILNKEIILSKIKHYQLFSIYSQMNLLGQISFVVLENSQYAAQFVSLREKYISELFNNMKDYIYKEPWKNIQIDQNCINSINLSRQASITLRVQDSNMKDVVKNNIQTIIRKNNMIVIHNDGTFDLSQCSVGKIASEIFLRYQKEIFSENKSVEK